MQCTAQMAEITHVDAVFFTLLCGFGYDPSTDDYLVVHACYNPKHQANCAEIQARMTLTGLINDTFPLSRVLAFCALADAGDIRYAHRLIRRIPEPNTFLWNSIIRGYNKARIPSTAFSNSLSNTSIFT